MENQRAWLASMPWTEVQATNQALCKQQSTAYQPSKTCDATRQIWEQAASRVLSLLEVLDVCRKCYEAAPFVFNNGNTFAGIARKIVDEWLESMPSVERQIVRNTIGHYVAGIVSRRELQKVLRHFQTSWNAFALAHQAVRMSSPAQPEQPVLQRSAAAQPQS